MLVSIIIPVYNVDNYLREALDSVVRQTFSNLEIIIVNDGSTDNSLSICKEYLIRDKRIKLINQSNKGLSCARNIGLDIMNGDFVFFLDSDDYIETNCIEKMLYSLTNTNVDIAICKYAVFNSDGLINYSKRRHELCPCLEKGVYDRASSLNALLDGKINVNVWNKLYKSELWRDIRFLEGHVYEDAEPSFKVFDKCKKVCMLDESLYNYRIRKSSITASLSINNINDCILAHDNVLNYIYKRIDGVFSKSQLLKNEQGILVYLISCYFKLCKDSVYKNTTISRFLREKIIKYKKRIGFNTLSLKYKVLYFSIVCFPDIIIALSKIIYT